MFVVCLGLSSFPFWTIGVMEFRGEPRCLLYAKTKYLYTTWLFIVFGMGELLIPSVIVSIFTVIIIYKLSQAAAERRRTCEGQRSSRQRRAAKESQPTLALVSIASTFVLLRLPYIIAFYLNEYKKELWPGMTKTQSFQIYTAYTLTFVFSTLNYAVSFLLFCVTGETFRKELRRCFMSCGGRKISRGSTYASTYSTSASVRYDAVKNDSPQQRSTKKPPDILIFNAENTEAKSV